MLPETPHSAERLERGGAKARPKGSGRASEPGGGSVEFFGARRTRREPPSWVSAGRRASAAVSDRAVSRRSHPLRVSDCALPRYPGGDAGLLHRTALLHGRDRGVVPVVLRDGRVSANAPRGTGGGVAARCGKAVGAPLLRGRVVADLPPRALVAVVLRRGSGVDDVAAFVQRNQGSDDLQDWPAEFEC